MIFSRNTALVLTFSTLLASSIGNVFAGGQLCFYCNGREIKTYAEFGDLKFALPPEDFEGKDIVEVVPIDNKENVAQAFIDAATDNKIHFVSYNLKDPKSGITYPYTAEIKALRNINQELNYVVTVTENDLDLPD